MSAIPAGYKQTEVGMIPIDWDRVQLTTVAQLESGHTPSRRFPKFWNGSIPWVSLHDTDALNDREIHLTQQSVTQEGIDNSSARILPKGTVVFSRTATVGKTTVLGRNMATSQDFANFICGPLVLNHYLVYLFRFMAPQWKKLMAGSIHNTVYMPVFLKLKVTLPPRKEQEAIAATLSDVDSLLAKLDQFIAKKRDLKQAAMQQLLTGQTRLPGFSGEWEVKTIEELEKIGILKLSRGKVISKKDIENAPGDNPIYSSSVKNDGLFGCYGEYMFDEEMITWSVDGGGHFFYRTKHKFSVTNVCGFLRVDTAKLGYRFLAAQLQLLHSKLKFDYQDKAHPSIIRKAYSLLIPSKAEQTAIAAVLSDIDAELAALEGRRDKTRALKLGIMQELLTGRIRLV